MSHPIRVLLLGALSLAVGLVVAFTISLVELTTDVALYRFSAALVIPVGAIGCGLVAAVGFYFASRSLHVRATGPAFTIPLITAIVTFFASHWFTYTRSELSTGSTLADAMTLDGLGSWGYAISAIEIAGFALGGWFVSSILRQKPWCERSRRFLTKRGSHTTLFDDPGLFESTANRLVDVLERGGAAAAFEHAVVEKSTMQSKRNARFRLTTDHFECGDCGGLHTVVSTQQRTDNNNWVQLSQTPLHPDEPATEHRVEQLVS